MKLRATVILAACVFLIASCEGSANVAQNANVNVPKPTPEPTPFDEFAFGRQIYSVSCGTCHKEDGRGGKVNIAGQSLDVADLNSDKAKKLDEDKILLAIFDGKPEKGMPAFKSRLSEPQIREVVKYVRNGIQQIPAATPTPEAKVANTNVAN